MQVIGNQAAYGTLLSLWPVLFFVLEGGEGESLLLEASALNDPLSKQATSCRTPCNLLKVQNRTEHQKWISAHFLPTPLIPLLFYKLTEVLFHPLSLDRGVSSLKKNNL